MRNAKPALDKLREFDPNDPRLGKGYMWATYIPARGSSPFRLHMGRGPALNACSHQSLFILYFWDAAMSRWAEACRSEGHHRTVCDACGKDAAGASDRYHSTLKFFFVGKPTLREVGMCRYCCGYTNGVKGPYYAMTALPVDQRVLV